MQDQSCRQLSQGHPNDRDVGELAVGRCESFLDLLQHLLVFGIELKAKFFGHNRSRIKQEKY